VQDLAQFWYLVSAALNAQTGRKICLSIVSNGWIHFEFDLFIYYLVHSLQEQENISWKFQQSKNSAIQPFKS